MLCSRLQGCEHLSIPIQLEGRRAEYSLGFAGPEPAVSTNKIARGIKIKKKLKNREREIRTEELSVG